MLREYNANRQRRKIHLRIRRKLLGSPERPRLSVYRSLNHMYAQVVDDLSGSTLVSASTVDTEGRKMAKRGGNVEAAKVVGRLIAERARAKGIENIVFDRSGYIYHGRVRALAEAAREAGLRF
ncbi:MAG: 50S ribosomal protein L18 [Acidobacteria bacterium]|nr:50S ribosomal protein L18 [Acidobacteriota bacterium]